LYVEGRGDAVAALWKGAVGRLALITVPLFFFLFAFAGIIIGLYLPQTFARSELVFRVFLLALPLRCAVYNPLLVGIGKAKWALWGALGDLGLNLILSVVFVQWLLPRGGEDLAMLGPATATVLSTYLQVGFLLIVIGRHLRRSLWELLPWARLLRVSAVSAVAGIAALAAASAVATPSLKLAVGALVFAAALTCLYWICPQDREEIRVVLRSALGRGVR
jgi:O-antigen/teichoic acid export membrane protein